MSSIPTTTTPPIQTTYCVECKKTKSETIRLFVCSSNMNPKGENFILCSECTSHDKLDFDTNVLFEPEHI